MNLKDIYFENKETKDLESVELLRKNAKYMFTTDFVWLPKNILGPKDLVNWFFCNSGKIGLHGIKIRKDC